MQKLDDEIARLNMVVAKAWLKRVDSWRAKQPDKPNRSEAVRQLVDRALRAKRS